MAETKPNSPKRGGLARKLGIAGGGVVLLLVIVYFVATSTAFFKGVILPKVSAALNATVTVENASISPFSHVSLRGLKVQTTGTEPLLTAQDVQARYSLMDIIGGHINVSDVVLNNPVIQLVENADGTSNLDPITKHKKAETAPGALAQPEGKPTQLNLQHLTLKNGLVRQIKHLKEGGRSVIELANLNLNAESIGNNKTGKLDLASDIRLENNLTHPAPTNGVLQATVNGTFNLALDAALKPQTISGNTRLDVVGAQGSYKDLAALNAVLTTELSPTEIKQVALRFAQGTKNLGELRVSGPFNLNTQEGKLQLEIVDLDPQVAKLGGAAVGMDFNKTKLNSRNTIDLSKNGKFILVNGQFTGSDLALTLEGKTTPALQLQLAYNLSVDQLQKVAQIQSFTLDGKQKESQMLHGALANPVKIDFSNPTNVIIGDSAFALKVVDLNLGDWKAFTGTSAPSGKVNLALNLLTQQAPGGSLVTVTGQVSAASLSVSQAGQATPPLDIQARWSVTVDQAKKTALVQTFTLQGTQKQKQFLRGALSKPMKLDFGKTEGAVDESAFELALTDFDLATWRGFVKEINPSGLLNLNLNLVSQQAGKKLSIELNSRLANLSATLASNQLDGANVQLNLRGQLDNFDTLTLSELQGQLARDQQPVASFNTTGKVGLKTQNVDLQTALNASLPGVLGTVKVPNMAASAGDLQFKGRIVQNSSVANGVTNSLQTITGTLNLNGFTGQMNSNRFDRFNTAADLAVVKSNQLTHIQKFNGTLSQNNQPGGGFDITGTYDGAKELGQFAIKLVNLNENGLRPFLESAMSGKKLVSIALNSTSTATLDLKGESSIKSDLQLTNFVVLDPKASAPGSPLEVRLQLDGSMKQKVLDLRKVQVNLTPTEKGKNELLLTGQVDTSNTNATRGALKLAAESIDVTRYYDIFSAKPGATDQGTAAPARSGPAPAPAPDDNKEPAPMKLPLDQFSLALNIGQFHLREVSITNWQTTLNVASNRVLIKPLQLVVNGAPITGNVDLNLGEPGYAYDITLAVDKVPLAPLANSFVQGKRDQYQGLIIANATLKGVGITGKSLQKNLQGNVSLSFTNANIQIVSPRWRPVLTLIGTSLRVPEITESPINYIFLETELGQGKITLKTASVESEAFFAQVSGIIPIADRLTNSPLNKLPVDFYLRRSLAEKANILPANTAADAKYVKLTSFVSLKGTLDKPEPEINKIALAQILASSGVLGKELKKIGGGLGTILGGGAPNAAPQTRGTNAPSTNAPAATTNAPATGGTVNQLMDIFGKKKPAAPTTNAAPATNAPTPSEKINQVLDLFKKK